LPKETFDTYFRELVTQKYATCKKKLRNEGVKSTSISTRNSAYDIESLRRALHLDKISLYGVSYGTRLALEYIELYPEHIDSVVLDSVMPDDVDKFTIDIFMRKRAMKEFFELCSSDETCLEAYPELETHFLGVVNHYNQHPYTYVYDEELNKTSILDGGYITYNVESLFPYPSMIEKLPAIIEGLYRETLTGDTDYLYSIAKSTQNMLLEDKTLYSPLMGSLIWLQTYPISLERMEEVYQRLDNYKGIYQHFYLYKLFTQSQVFHGRKESVHNHYLNTIPTLILNGSRDHATPIEFAEDIHARLANSQMITFKNYGHAIITSSCGYKTIKTFFQDPENFTPPECTKIPISFHFIVPKR
jgi:pimeloyl-ACP methyl ester carboxylesterase